METATIISIIATLISIGALIQARLSHKQTVIINLENRLATMADRCNSYIDNISQSHPINTQEVSAVLTYIINARKLLKIAYKSHGHLLIFCDIEDFVVFFSTLLHSSIIELIKNELPDSVNDLALRPDMELQHKKCREFLAKSL